MGKPPALPVDSQSLTVPGKMGSLPLQNRSKFKKRRLPMYDEQSLSHSKWECKYHVIWIPKYRKKSIFGDLRQYLGAIFRELARQKECTVIEGHLMSDHVHILLSIPPKYSVAQIVGFIKGKSAIQIARNFQGRKKNFVGQNFWARGYYVSTVGKDEDAVRAYIQHQEKEDKRLDQHSLFK
jgi:putative transposase